MTGYKVAVGIDEKEGPFPVIVKLDIPEDATIVIPEDKVAIEDYSDIGTRILLRTEPKLIQKCRTNKVKVVEMWPLGDVVFNWNHKAYSFFELDFVRNRLVIDFNYNCFDRIITYSSGKELYEPVLLSKKEACGPGINYFNSLEDARDYYCNDIYEWAANLMLLFKQIWRSKIINNNFKEVMIALSKEEE